MSTPTLDKFGLHPFGHRCTRFSQPYARCAGCTAEQAYQERWRNLTPKQRTLAEAELESLRVPDTDSRGTI